MIKLEELKNMAAALDDIRRVDEKKMDKVDKDAVKGDFEDREDKDIDNDGDVDSSDRYLHNRRKAITKAMAKEETDLDEESQPTWKVQIGKKHYTVTARNTAEADKKAKMLAAKEGNRGVGGKIERINEAKKDDYHKLMLKALGKSRLPKDHNFTSAIANNGDFVVHDGGGRVVGRIKKGEYNLDEAKNAADHRQGLIDKIKKSGVVKSGSMSKKSMKEKAESEAQAIAARIALKHKREGTKPEPGTASAEMMKMSEKDLEDFTKMKKGAPYKVEEAADITKMSHGRLKWHMNTGVPHGSYTNAEMKKERDRRLKYRDSADAYKKAKPGLNENFMKAKGAPYKVNEDAWQEIPMMKRQLQFIKYAADEIMGYMDMTMDPEEWFQNKLAHVHDQMQSLHAYIEGDKRMMAMEAVELDEKVYASDYNVGYEKSQFGGYRPHVTHKKTGKTMYLGQTSYKKPEHAKGHAAAYLKGYEQMGDTTARRYANEYEKANKQHVYKEAVELDEATDAEIRAKQTAGATEPEGIADKESEGSKKFMMMHTTQVPGEVNVDEINRMNAEEIKASLQRKVSYRWNDQKIGDK